MKDLIRISILVAILFVSCEEQMIPIPEAPDATEGRVMIIEEFTGVSCPPCALAIETLNAIIDENKGSILVYGIHAGTQTDPLEDSKYDFRYKDAEVLELNFNPGGKPAASFNRVTLNNGRKTQINHNTWQPIIDVELVKPQVAEILMKSTYDPETRQAQIDLSMIPLEDIDGEISVHMVIAENNLIDPQIKQGTGTVKDFEHNHVMKKSLTGDIQGAFLTENATTGTIYRYSASYTLPDEVNGEWIPENMEIIAFVTAKDRDGEVQQATKIDLVE